MSFDCLLFFSVGPGDTAFTLIFGANLIAEVVVRVPSAVYLKYKKRKKGVSFSIL